MRLIWSKAAARDLQQVASHIAQDSEQAAQLVESRIHEAAKLLLIIPEAGRPGRVSGTRELVALRTPYILVYRRNSGRIHILRIYHGARLWPSKFEP
ncbi:MAG TPA: type II toxin-antitoxin system RelE/ParE family toxin [Terracidiphilus sp.]|nr:type II toxin-antitoxin system RelE/ParE family toxin [Terracidiphilus sp.]